MYLSVLSARKPLTHHSLSRPRPHVLKCSLTLTIGLLASAAFAQQPEIPSAPVSNASATGASQTVPDRTQWFQDQVEKSTGMLQLPAGTLRISRPIVVNLKETGLRGIRGAQGTTRIVMTGPGPALRIAGDHQGTAAPPSIQSHTWRRERMPIVSDLEIVGEHPEADGIELVCTMQTIIDRVSIRRCRYGIHLVQRNRNFILKGSHIFDGLDSGLFFDHCNLHQVNILGNHISYNRRAGIRQLEGDVHNVQISGNDIEYNSGTELISAEILLEAPTGFISEYVIANNTIQATPDAKGANILIAGKPGPSPDSARTMTITGNVIGSRTENIRVAHATRITITGNTIYGGTQLNVHLTNCHSTLVGSNNVGTRPSQHSTSDRYQDGVLLQQCVDCILTGNIFSDLRGGSGADAIGGSVVLDGCRNTAIANCQIINPGDRGILVVDTVGCHVSNNSITDRQIGAAAATAIEVIGKSSQVVVQNNSITPGTDRSIICSSRRGVIRENVIWPRPAPER